MNCILILKTELVDLDFFSLYIFSYSEKKTLIKRNKTLFKTLLKNVLLLQIV